MHKTQFIQGFFYGVCKCEDPLGIHISANRTNLKEKTLEEYKTVASTMMYCQVRRYSKIVSLDRSGGGSWNCRTKDASEWYLLNLLLIL